MLDKVQYRACASSEIQSVCKQIVFEPPLWLRHNVCHLRWLNCNIDCNIDCWSKCLSIIYDKANVQSKAETDSIHRQQWSHLMYATDGIRNYLQKKYNHSIRIKGFIIESEIEGQSQSSPISIGISTVLRCIFVNSLDHGNLLYQIWLASNDVFIDNLLLYLSCRVHTISVREWTPSQAYLLSLLYALMLDTPE